MISKKEPETLCLWLFLFNGVLYFTSILLAADPVRYPDVGMLGRVNQVSVGVRFGDGHRCIPIRDEYV